MRTFILLFILLASIPSMAQHLIVQRNGNMRAEANTSSEILERIHTGDTLLLIETEKTANYWHVRGKLSGQEGWVYTTLVRKIEGEVEEPFLEDDNTVVDIRVLDVGAGLCTLIKLPGDKYVIYDAGSDAKLNGERTLAQIKEYIPAGATIELMVLSHCDADHINAAGQVVRDYNIKKVLWTGFEASMVGNTTTGAYKRLVQNLQLKHSTENVNLHEADSAIVPGNHFSVGQAKFTFLCGFGNPDTSWHGLDKAEKLNGVSIVMRLDFKGNSVLFCGDAVGRHREDPRDALIATEQFMVSNAAEFLPATVIIAPHHGAKNGSSTAFVKLVKPKAVIFSCGHQFHHPSTRTAQLYLEDPELTTANIFRTDRGDDEGPDEWVFKKKAGCTDDYNDDTIQVQLFSNHTFRVYYMNVVDGVCKN